MEGFLDLLSEELGDSKNAGNNTRYRCPFCGEDNYKFYVRNDTGIYQCFHCGSKGNALKFLEVYYGYSYKEAKEQVEDWSGETIDAKTTERFSELSDMESLFLAIAKGPHKVEQAEEAKTTIPLPTNFKPLYQNMNNPEAFPYLTYLNNRGVTLEEIYTHVMGYVIEGQVRKSSLTEDGETDYFTIRNSIVFLTFDDNGNYLYWNSRSIEKNPMVKSLNGPALSNEHSKNDVIFNLNKARKTNEIVIFEGVFNALMAGQSGVATFGKMITDSQLELLKQAYEDNHELRFVVFLDSDARKQATDLASRLATFTKNVYIVDSPYGDKDANDLGREITQELIRNAKRYSEISSLEVLLHGLGNL